MLPVGSRYLHVLTFCYGRKGWYEINTTYTADPDRIEIKKFCTDRGVPFSLYDDTILNELRIFCAVKCGDWRIVSKLIRTVPRTDIYRHFRFVI